VGRYCESAQPLVSFWGHDGGRDPNSTWTIQDANSRFQTYKSVRRTPVLEKTVNESDEPARPTSRPSCVDVRPFPSTSTRGRLVDEHARWRVVRLIKIQTTTYSRTTHSPLHTGPLRVYEH